MVTLHGFDDLARKLKAARQVIPRETKANIEAAGRLTEQGAKNDAPVDQGDLVKSIYFEVINNGWGSRVTASAEHAPFVEFGTGGAVAVPDGWTDIAAQFKGKGVREVNLPAQPYLIPNYRIQADELIKRLETLLKRTL